VAVRDGQMRTRGSVAIQVFFKMYWGLGLGNSIG
jgi:hypothetical protein